MSGSTGVSGSVTMCLGQRGSAGILFVGKVRRSDASCWSKESEIEDKTERRKGGWRREGEK